MEYKVIEMSPYIDSKQVCEMLNIDLTTLARWRKHKTDGFPQPVKRTYKKCIYRTQDVIDWVEAGTK